MTGWSQFSPVTRGIIMMILAIVFFSSMDALAKALSPHIGTPQVLWARYAGQTILVGLLVVPRARTVLRTRYPKLQFLRSMLQLGATSFFFFSLGYIGLAEATAIMDINPVMITLGAALFLGEKIGLRRALGIGAALIGAMIIIRPGGAVFSPAAILPLCGALCYSGYALATRFLGRDEDVWTSMLYTALVGTVVLSCILPFAWVTPTPLHMLGMALVACMGAGGQFMLISAFSQAEASVVAPFGYVGLLIATVWGMIFFDEYPDLYTILGALVIVAAGLYVWYRETKATAHS